MNRSETVQIISVLQFNYPDTFKSYSEDQLKGMVTLWASCFSEIPFEAVGSAVKKYIMTSTDHFMPNIGQIMSMLPASDSDEIPEFKAVALIRKACSNGYYGADDEFRKLPPIIQKLVGSSAQIKAWSKVSEDEFETVIASHIVREYRSLQKREHDNAHTPAEVRAVLHGTSDNISIGEKPEVQSLPEHSIAEKIIAQKQAEADRLDEYRKELKNRTDEEIAVSRKENMAKLDSLIKGKGKAGG